MSNQSSGSFDIFEIFQAADDAADLNLPSMQVLYHVYEESELKPLLEAANAVVAKEKADEA